MFTKSLIYKIGFWSVFISQLIICFVVPYFLFYLLETNTLYLKSFYLSNSNVWHYFLILFILNSIGVITNLFSFFSVVNKYYLIRIFILIISVLPIPLILPLVLCQLIESKQEHTPKSKILFNKNSTEDHLLNLQKVGLYGLLISNIFTIVWLLVMFNIGSFFPVKLNVDYSRIPITYLTIYGVWTTLSLISVILVLIFKKDYLILITAIISFPLFIILGSVFAALLFLSLKNYFQTWFLHNKNYFTFLK